MKYSEYHLYQILFKTEMIIFKSPQVFTKSLISSKNIDLSQKTYISQKSTKYFLLINNQDLSIFDKFDKFDNLPKFALKIHVWNF